MKVLTFDIETRQSPPLVGWQNYAEQGIAVLCAHLSWCDEYRYCGEENLADLQAWLDEADIVTGFNILGFDVPLAEATAQRLGFKLDFSRSILYDVLADIRETVGNPYVKGFRLQQVAKNTLAICKNGDGADAPALWEKGKIAQLYTYVTQDVKVERTLFEHVVAHGWVQGELSRVHLRGIGQVLAKFPAAA